MSFLGSLFGAKKTNAHVAVQATGIPIQTSAYGVAIAVAYGTTQLSCNLLDYANFTAIAKNSPARSGGGKGGVTGGGGGKGGGGTTSYDYKADLVMGICEGPIDGIGNMWVSQTETTPAAQGLTIYDGTYPQAVFRAYPYDGIANAAVRQFDMGSNGQLPNFRFEVIRRTGFMAPNGLDADPSKVVVDLLTNAFYGAGFAASQIGTLATENEPYTIPSSTPYQITVAQAASFQFNLAVAASWAANGAALQCVAASPKTGQYSYAAGIYTFAAADAGKKVTIRYAALGSLAAYQNFTLANGLWISPAYATQTNASSLIDDIAKFTYSSVVVSAGVMTLVPNGTSSVAANGYTYAPPAAPLFDLGPDNFLPNLNVTGTAGAGTNNFPLIVTRGDPTAQPNDFKIQFKDRGNQYAASIAEFVDQANADAYAGKKAPSSESGDIFSDAAAANVSVRFLAEAIQVRNGYSFTLGPQWCFLDAMDIVTASDPAQGIVKDWVRIQEMTENDDGSFSCTATEYPAGTGAPATYQINVGQGYIPNYNQDPGPVNPPIVFGMPVALAQGLAIGCAISGASALWKGADVFVSSDGSTYKLVGRQTGPARMGVTTADFPVGADPDTADMLNVDLTESLGELLSGTQADADLGHTLCLVAGSNGVEYVSYETATLTGANKYALGTYLRRGQQGSAIVDHPSASPFARMDDSIFQVPFTADQIGKTLYLKFTSFNVFDGGEENLASVTAYTIAVPAPPAPPDVTNFGVAQNGNVVAFGWDKVIDYALKGYDLSYAPVGTTLWADFIPLTEVEAGTEMTTASVPPGTWLFGIRARDIADQLSPDIATATLTVINQNEVIYDADEAQTRIPANAAIASPTPGWGGTLTNCMLHYTGVLVPNGTKALSNYATWAALETNGSLLPDPMSSLSYATGAIDTGYVDTLRTFNLSNHFMAPGQTGTPTIGYAIDVWSTGSDPAVFAPWTIGTLSLRYLRSEIAITGVANGSIPIITDFTPVIDSAPVVEQSNGNVTVAAGGTPIMFPTPFHFPPIVDPTATGVGMTSASAVNITATGFDLHGWTGSTDTGGTASWQAQGE